tara:strand:- start:13057 stop:13557 length:501 start_codon:yes stop_codon:yes gene_type:complete
MITQTGVAFVDSNTMVNSHNPSNQWFLDEMNKQADCRHALSRLMPFFREELGFLEVTHNALDTFFTVSYSGCYGPSKTPCQTIKVHLIAYASPTSDKPGYFEISLHDSENKAIFMAEGYSPFSLDGGFSRTTSGYPPHVIDTIQHLMSTGYLTREGIPDDVPGSAP